jgi:hypothetical protein
MFNEAEIEESSQTSVVTRVAGEDIRPGDLMTLSMEVIELPSYLWCCDSTTTAKDEIIRLRYLPRESGEPFKVISACLPFVYAKKASGKLVTFDTRKHQLVKLDKACGKKVWKALRAKNES